MDSAKLDHWRKVVRGEAGFNGHPQALLGLLRVSDTANLLQLKLAYPEAVAAYVEEQTGELPDWAQAAVDGERIRLTLVTAQMRGTPRVFPTGNLGEALAQYALRHFGPGSNAGPPTWIISFVIEQGDERVEPGETVRTFRSIASLEGMREAHAEPGVGEPEDPAKLAEQIVDACGELGVRVRGLSDVYPGAVIVDHSFTSPAVRKLADRFRLVPSGDATIVEHRTCSQSACGRHEPCSAEKSGWCAHPDASDGGP